MGEVIKLRSDCIREAPEGPEANEFRARDVRDLSILLLQALTQQRKLAVGTTLPAPFHEIVTNGISGTWGLPQISAALAPPSIPKAPSASPTTVTQSTTYTPPAKSESTRPAAPLAAPVEDAPRRLIPWTTIAAVLILALFIGWHFLHKTPAPIHTLATMPEQVSPSVAATSESGTSPTTGSNAPTANASTQNSRTENAHTQWRVVAYTYNHEDQAKAKAALIASQHAFLNPEVFSPKGHAPYLVTVGGPMSRNEALTFRKRARSAGLPHDIYAQNFPANAR